MTKLEVLQSNVVSKKAHTERCVQDCKDIQRNLDLAESTLIEAKECLRKAEEELETYKNTYVLTDVDQEARDRDIEEFRQRLPIVMKKVDEQDKIRQEKEAKIELDNFKQKIHDRKVGNNGNDQGPVAQA
jgi:chromosome segregation ATPase